MIIDGAGASVWGLLVGWAGACADGCSLQWISCFSCLFLFESLSPFVGCNDQGYHTEYDQEKLNSMVSGEIPFLGSEVD